MTLVKVFPIFECIIYSDIEFQSAISVCSPGNSRSFTVLTDRLAFVNFSSPDGDEVHTFEISLVLNVGFMLACC